MKWNIEFHPAFVAEFKEYSEKLQDGILAKSLLLEAFGPRLGRPHVDTLKNSRHVNMKELRLYVDNGVWRVAFAFDPERKAVLLVAGDKASGSRQLFYKDLIRKADKRFDEHLSELEKGS
jgi:hypothetical protein